MNNDYKASQANHSSLSSNKPFAKRILRQNNNRLTFQQNSSPYQANSYYPSHSYNIRSEPHQFEEEIVRGYYINEREEQRYRNENGGEDDEIDIEENQYYNDEYENGEENNLVNEGFIGDSEFVRNDMTNNNNMENNNYSPNQNGQDIYAYYNLRNFNKNLNNNINREYNYEPRENFDDIEQEENAEYIIQSPIQENFSRTNYNFNYKISQKKPNKENNLRDSVSSEAYANKSVSRATLTDYRNTGVYTKPKIIYNNNKNINNGISTLEQDIESLKEKPKKIEEESPIYNYPEIPQEKKGGKVDLNLSLNKLKKMKKNYKKNEYDMTNYEKNLDKVIKIQATFRYFVIKQIMDKYHKYDEFIFHISKVQFNHFYDNFYFFINQLFNVYKANTIGGLNLEDNQDEKNEEEEENIEESDEDYEEENEENNKKSYDHLLNDYKNLKKKYNALRKNKFSDNSNNNNANNNNNSKSSFKKLNQELASLQGETTFGSIRTDTNKFHKFKANLLNNNNSTSNIKDNLTISNYNEDEKYERHYYTPDHYDDDSFNDIKDNRYSYSSIHSDENSKYFDNEQPRKRFKSLNINKIKGMGLNKGNAKNKVFEYSPTIEMDKQSRGNSTKRNNNINESQNDRINNLSIININKSALDEPEDIFDRKKIEEMTYEKYINNYSKDLRIVKNNKIFLKNDEEKLLNKKKLRPKLAIKENEVIELKAKEKSDEQKMKEIFDNKKLLEKMRAKLEKENAKKYRHNNITGEEGTSVPNIDNRYKLLKNLKKTKEKNISINQGKKIEKKILEKTNENDFEIKSEYYYIETKDSMLPEIIEKKIKESNLINQQRIKEENEFNKNKTIFSIETNFNIEGKKQNKFQDIESNELSIINNTKKIKKKNEIKKNDEIKINSEPKKWDVQEDLNLISNDEFSLNKKEKENINENKDKNNQLYIENNELEIIDTIRKNKKKEKIVEKIIKKFDIITPAQNEEILINKKYTKNEKAENKNIPLIKCNENDINIKPMEKPKVREIKITTKKILKQEKFIRTKKFLKNVSASENSIFINGTKSQNNIWKNDKLIPSKKDEFLIKRKKHKTKESEIQTNELFENKKKFEKMKIEELDKINIDSKNKAFIEHYIDKLKETENKGKMYFIDTSNQIHIKSKNKIQKIFKNLNIGKTKENEINIENNEEELNNLLRAKKKEKNKKEVKPNLIEQFTFEGEKKPIEKKIFTDLDIKKCEGQFIKPTKKSQKNLEKISNTELVIKKQKILRKETETQIEPNLLNDNLVLNNDINYKINPLKKEENIIVKNNSINIKHRKPQSNSDLIIVRQKKLNLLQNSLKKFSNENIEPCYSESICIKTREEYEEPLPNFKLAKKFNKLLISENDNLIPENNINLISNDLSQINEAQFEIIGKNNLLKENNVEKEDEYIELKPDIEIKNNNEDLEKNMTKQFINNMVQNKFEIEKKKNMENTKNKLITIIKANKMKNALNKNTRNKKYFFDKLKNIKNSKKILSISNSFNYNYLTNIKYKAETFTDTLDLTNKFINDLFIDNNTIEIRKKNKLLKNKNLSEIKENDINIEAIKKKEVEKVDEEIQMSPKKEFKITTKRTFKKEKIIKKHFSNIQNTQSDSFSFEKENKEKKEEIPKPNPKKYVDTQTQTPKLRPQRLIKNSKNANITFEINHTLDMSYMGKNNINNENENENENEKSDINNISIKVEKEEIKDDKTKIYRIDKFNEFFKYYFDINNKKIPFLKLLYLTKWIHLTKNCDLDKSKTRDFKNLSKKYYSIVAYKLKDFSEKYKKTKAVDYLMNLFNRRKKEVIKAIKMKKKGNENDVVLLRKKKNALHKLNKVLRKYCRKYVFNLYKKNKK